MVGFNGIITYPSGDNIRSLLQKTPLKSILLETDAPYLPPQLKRNSKEKSVFKYGEPVDLLEIIKEIASIKNKTEKEIVDTSTENFTKLFRLDDYL